MNRIKWVVLASLCILTWIPPSSQADCGLRSPYDEGAEESNKGKEQTLADLDSKPGEWPWTVSIQLNDSHLCTGSILSPSWILSAAHCFNEVNIKDLNVQVGATTLGDEDRKVNKVDKLIRHEKFSQFPAQNDVALLLVTPRIVIDKLTTPICLPPAAPLKIEDWRSCHMSGWGVRFDSNKPVSKVLQSVEMELMKMEPCKEFLWSPNENIFCAEYDTAVRGALQADSGGPLMCRKLENNTWYQVGVFGWSNGCGRWNTPGMYTLLSSYLTWIRDKTREAGPPEDRPVEGHATPLMSAFFMCQYLWVFVMVVQVTTAG